MGHAILKFSIIVWNFSLISKHSALRIPKSATMNQRVHFVHWAHWSLTKFVTICSSTSLYSCYYLLLPVAVLLLFEHWSWWMGRTDSEHCCTWTAWSPAHLAGMLAAEMRQRKWHFESKSMYENLKIWDLDISHFSPYFQKLLVTRQFTIVI